MVINLNGYLPHRELHNLNALCAENNIETPVGYFTDTTFVSDKDLPQDVCDLISNTFAPTSKSEIKKRLVDAIQSYLDTEAKAHFYDGILSLCSYATSTNPKFGPEGQAGVIWRDACWLKGIAIMAEVESQTRSIPTIEELLAEMPAMVWP